VKLGDIALASRAMRSAAFGPGSAVLISGFRVSRPRRSAHLRVPDGRALAALKPASRGRALRRHASIDALLAAPPSPWLRPSEAADLHRLAGT